LPKTAFDVKEADEKKRRKNNRHCCRPLEPTAKGDPMSPLRWTTKSMSRLCAALQEKGFEISPRQVGRLLHELEYRLSGNRKSIEG
jgi:transposase